MERKLAQVCYRLLVAIHERIRWDVHLRGEHLGHYDRNPFELLVHRLQQIDEDRPLVGVCARLFHMVVKSQALRNANHRSATYLLRRFLDFHGIRFPEEELQEEEWFEVCDDVFGLSKAMVRSEVYSEPEYEQLIADWILRSSPSYRGQLEETLEEPLTAFLKHVYVKYSVP